MLRLLVSLGRWIDARFPERIEVTKLDYDALHARLGALEAKLEDVQKAAVHKDAVRDVIAVVKQVKDDIQSFKTSLGFNRPANPDLAAVLNGEYLNGDNQNG